MELNMSAEGMESDFDEDTLALVRKTARELSVEHRMTVEQSVEIYMFILGMLKRFTINQSKQRRS
jgi:hypothetical protein